MSDGSSLEAAAAALRESIKQAASGLIERGVLVENIVLAAVAGEHLLAIGPPGTAKSEAVRRVAQTLGGTYFEYLLGRFTEPNEVFGPIDLRKLREGIVETETSGMLPEAEIAFLDEIFSVDRHPQHTPRYFERARLSPGPYPDGVPYPRLHRRFQRAAGRRDARRLRRPVSHPHLSRSIPDPRIEELLEGGWQLSGSPMTPRSSIMDVDLLAAHARLADMSELRPALAQAIRKLRHAGIALTDRRAVKIQRLIAAAAALAGRSKPAEADVWPIVLAVPTREQQAMARETLRDLLAAAENAALPNAAEDASHGPLARAARLTAFGNEILAARPATADEREMEAWQLRLEGVAREIDAGFATDALPAPLGEVRARIVAVVRESVGAVSP